MGCDSTLLPVKKNGLYFYINDSAEKVTETFDWAGLFHFCKYAWIEKNNQSLLVDIDFNVLYHGLDSLYPISDSILIVQKANSFDMLDERGNVQLQWQAENIEILNYGVRVQNKGAMGLISLDGKWLIPAKYDYISKIKAFHYSPSNTYEHPIYFTALKDSLVGLYNQYGEKILDPKYSQITPFDEYIEIEQKGKKGVYLPNIKKQVGEIHWDYFQEYNGIWLKAYNQDGSMVIRLKDGTVLSTSRFDDMYPLSCKYIAVRDSDKIGLIDSTGKIIVKPQFDALYCGTEKASIFLKDNKYGIVSHNDSIIIQAKYNQISLRGDDHFRLKIDDLEGLANSNGELVVPANFHRIDIHNNFYITRHVNLAGVYDKSGERLEICRLNYFRVYENFVIGRKGNDFGLISLDTITSYTYNHFSGNDDLVKMYSADSLKMFVFEEASLQGIETMHLPVVQVGARSIGLLPDVTPTFTGDLVAGPPRIFHSQKTGNYGIKRTEGTILLEPVYQKIYKTSADDVYILEKRKPKADTIYFGDFWLKSEYEYSLYSPYRRYHLKIQPGLAIKYIPNLESSSKGVNHMMLRKDANWKTYVREKSKHIELKYKHSINVNQILCFATDHAKWTITKNPTFNDQTIYDLYYHLNLYRPLRPARKQDYIQMLNDSLKIALSSEEWKIVRKQFRYNSDVLAYKIEDETYKGVLDLNNSWQLVKNDTAYKFFQIHHHHTTTKDQKIALHKFQYVPKKMLVDGTREYLIANHVEPSTGLIDQKGNWLIQPDYGVLKSLDNNYFVAEQKAVQSNWGVLKSNGDTVLDFQYELLKPFVNNRIPVGKGYATLGGTRFLWQVMDTTGRVLSQDIEYKDITPFYNQVAVVKERSKYFLIDTNLKKLKGPFKKLNPIQDSPLYVFKSKRLYGVMDSSGKKLVPPKFKRIQIEDHGVLKCKKPSFWTGSNTYFLYSIANKSFIGKGWKKTKHFGEGIAVLKKNKYAEIDTLGHQVLAYKFNKLKSRYYGITPARRNRNWYLYNSQNQDFTGPFYMVGDYKYGICLVQNERKESPFYLDRSYKTFQLPTYLKVQSFVENTPFVVSDTLERIFYTNESGTRLSRYYQDAKGFQNGVALVKQNYKWGIINKKDKYICKPTFSKIYPFQNNKALVEINYLKGVYEINQNQVKETIPPYFEKITYTPSKHFRVEKTGRIGYFTSDGTLIWDLQK